MADGVCIRLYDEADFTARPRFTDPEILRSSLAGVILLGLIFNILNFENGLGTFSLSAYWQSVIRGAFLLLVVVAQAKLVARGAPAEG